MAILDHNEFEFDCCGFVSEWQFYPVEEGTFDAQVWRLQEEPSYMLVGSNSLTASREYIIMHCLSTLSQNICIE